MCDHRVDQTWLTTKCLFEIYSDSVRSLCVHAPHNLPTFFKHFAGIGSYRDPVRPARVFFYLNTVLAQNFTVGVYYFSFFHFDKNVFYTPLI